MPDANELLRSNLHEVFSERDPKRRWAAIERTYTEDVRFIDPEGEFVGRQALSGQAQKLLDGLVADFVFEEDGPCYIGTDTAALAWRFGPPGSPVARGIDILTFGEGLVNMSSSMLTPSTITRECVIVESLPRYRCCRLASSRSATASSSRRCCENPGVSSNVGTILLSYHQHRADVVVSDGV